ncbi:MAG: hypothetical protein IJW60_03535 [Clostridia bacterium]|nr:hypothetical protein [Clostridia bacterium]
MKIYFLSSEPCALTVGEAYLGLVDKFERFAEINLKDNLFVRFTPEKANPLGFFLNESVQFTPPDGCEVYLLDGALAIYARDFPPRATALNVLAQKRFDCGTLTLFYQGALQLSIETAKGFFVSTLPPAFEKAELFFESGLFFLKTPERLAAYTQTGKQVLLENVLSCSFENGVLSARLPLSDSLGRVADCKWELDEDGLRRTQCTLLQARTYNGDNHAQTLRDELLPFAFFESVLLGADVSPFLSEELLPQAEKLKDFLGHFVAVTLTPSPNVCGLVYEKSERLFEVIPFTVTLEQGKIADVRR